MSFRSQRSMARLASMIRGEGLVLVGTHPLFLETPPQWWERRIEVEVESRPCKGCKKIVRMDGTVPHGAVKQYVAYRQNVVELLSFFGLEHDNGWFLLNDRAAILDLYEILCGEGVFSGTGLPKQQAERFIPSEKGEYRAEWLAPEVKSSRGVFSFGVYRSVCVRKTREQLRADFGSMLPIPENDLLRIENAA